MYVLLILFETALRWFGGFVCIFKKMIAKDLCNDGN